MASYPNCNLVANGTTLNKLAAWWQFSMLLCCITVVSLVTERFGDSKTILLLAVSLQATLRHQQASIFSYCATICRWISLYFLSKNAKKYISQNVELFLLMCFFPFSRLNFVFGRHDSQDVSFFFFSRLSRGGLGYTVIYIQTLRCIFTMFSEITA